LAASGEANHIDAHQQITRAPRINSQAINHFSWRVNQLGRLSQVVAPLQALHTGRRSL
jgi:hypothetical protein